jgi:mono/diheme cytochrome c family protein
MKLEKVVVKVVCGLIVIVLASQHMNTASVAADSLGEGASKGKRIFARHCAGCHGPEGKGDGYLLLGPAPANLNRSATKNKSEAALLNTIHEGKPNMPAWKLRLSEEDSRAVVAYIKTLGK